MSTIKMVPIILMPLILYFLPNCVSHFKLLSMLTLGKCFCFKCIKKKTFVTYKK